MFHLGSPDVLPVGDLGVRKGMQTLYGLKVRSQLAEHSQRTWLCEGGGTRAGLEGSPTVRTAPCPTLNTLRAPGVLPLLQELPNADTMHRIAEKWRPFASLGSYYM